MLLRNAFLFLSRHKGLRRWMEISAAARPLTRRFIAGKTLADVLGVSRDLNAQGIWATLDHLGENVTSLEEAEASRKAMEEALEGIAKSGLPATISIKLTQFGLDFSTDVCFRNVSVLALKAKEIGSRVEIDMEASEYVDRTLEVVGRLQAEFGCVRSVIQAYLFRSEADIRQMNTLGIPVRLCKGAYNEPPEIAFAEKAKVDANYLKLARLLLDEGTYPALATHDPAMIDGVLKHLQGKAGAKGQFEFQMLYGVRRDLQENLVRDGYRVRLYVPFGDAWYPYFMRRLAERPANVLFVARNLLRA
jgi:proline dehydrogenase